MPHSSSSRKGLGFCARRRLSSSARKRRCRCCWKNRADSSSGRWISKAVAVPFDADRAIVERRLDEICDAHLTALPIGIADAIRYGLKSPGKRIRPLLVVYAYRAAGGSGDATMLSCAPEVIHAYSLVHDDLPCMDDDDMRRGRPTVHKVYGSRTAIIAGVAMIPLAALVVRDAARAMHLPHDVRDAILGTLMESGGVSGMIGGQARISRARASPFSGREGNNPRRQDGRAHSGLAYDRRTGRGCLAVCA